MIWNNRLSYIVVTGITILSFACGSKKSGQDNQQHTQIYSVMKVTAIKTTLLTDYPASLKGIQDIEIRPKIDGYIEKVYTDEGALVKAGQPLFRIRNPQYEQEVRSAEAAVKSVEADVALAELQVKKTQSLVEKDIISPYELASDQLTLRSKKAALAQAEATLINAKVNVGYTMVSSPVNGVVGTLPFKLGSYVSSAGNTPLTKVSDIGTVYAYFSLNEKQMLALLSNSIQYSMKEAISRIPLVTLILADGSEYSRRGKVETISGQVEESTGSSNVRAGFVNTGVLRSGNSATIRIPTEVKNAIIIPQSATYELQNKRMAYIVDSSSAIKAVEVQVREVPGGKYFVVDKGLNLGQRVVLEGVGITPEGTKIKPHEVDADSVLNTAQNSTALTTTTQK